MITPASPSILPATAVAGDQGSAPLATVPASTLVVSLENFDIRYASPRAVEWFGLPAERLLGRSLLLSLPALGQALTLAVAGGLSPVPTPLNVALENTDGARLAAYVHQREADAVLEFKLADTLGTVAPVADTPSVPVPVPDPIGLQRRMDELRQDLVALRTRIPCDEAMLRGEDPILFWLWQAEAALAQVSQRCGAFVATQRKTTGSFRRTP